MAAALNSITNERTGVRAFCALLTGCDRHSMRSLLLIARRWFRIFNCPSVTIIPLVIWLTRMPYALVEDNLHRQFVMSFEF